VARNIWRAWQEGAYQHALTLYFKTLITEELPVLGFKRSRL
jgi:hypothetical protein